MKHGALAVALLLAVAGMLAGTGQVFAQETSSAGEFITPHTATVGFPFVIGDQTLPAGKYTIEQPTRELLIFQEEKRGAPRVEAKVITRLAARELPNSQPTLVFDKVGETYHLSEVWFRGRDGFLIYGTQAPHTHQHAKADMKK
jgi:hypothetical protein